MDKTYELDKEFRNLRDLIFEEDARLSTQAAFLPKKEPLQSKEDVRNCCHAIFCN